MFAIMAPRAFDGEQQLPGGATLLIDDGRIAGLAPAAAPLPEKLHSRRIPPCHRPAGAHRHARAPWW